MSEIPSIILVRPQMGENIGAAARAMLNFGLHDLRLVAPRDGWPNAKAVKMSAHAKAIIEQAQIFDNLSAALADKQIAYAATARPRDLAIKIFSPVDAAEKLRQTPEFTSALVFGPENCGLNNEDIIACNAVVTIPTNPQNSSLNIAQSVVLLAYEWFKTANIAPEKVPEPATFSEIEGLFSHLDGELDKKGFYKTPDLKPMMQQNLRAMLARSGFTLQEVRTLRGAIRALTANR